MQDFCEALGRVKGGAFAFLMVGAPLGCGSQRTSRFQTERLGTQLRGAVLREKEAATPITLITLFFHVVYWERICRRSLWGESSGITGRSGRFGDETTGRGCFGGGDGRASKS